MRSCRQMSSFISLMEMRGTIRLWMVGKVAAGWGGEVRVHQSPPSSMVHNPTKRAVYTPNHELVMFCLQKLVSYLKIKEP